MLRPPVLAVEDSALDAEILRRSLRKLGDCPLQVLSHGLDAREKLALFGTHASTLPLPCLILLDLHLPGATGWELLEKVRANPALADLPLIMLTSSEDDDDRVEALGLPHVLASRKPVPLELLKRLLEPSSVTREG